MASVARRVLLLASLSLTVKICVGLSKIEKAHKPCKIIGSGTSFEGTHQTTFLLILSGALTSGSCRWGHGLQKHNMDTPLKGAAGKHIIIQGCFKACLGSLIHTNSDVRCNLQVLVVVVNQVLQKDFHQRTTANQPRCGRCSNEKQSES
ncbi:uncharacterized protein PGTG_17364 [Puccinia graminis f. sp. tritici CRL 75-36-700-3]|uniref:Uncharacterized protein n=1 Tax=Puccinia graminis f. sp. tritici (strain CRL 75-36-700-3 / race SCCL) TaxID=418459 RepID=E3L4D3_PUCGT|nr:uncharacterized protein PGTG_17364 [Puccinia graminis f. sp. tritici CRL 75-36-700-3]EFP91408.1 hypothetical protein PGTG_17364 [Puccinia graminis f. sp. tritici CRL 75-36-700-3]